MSGRRNDHWSLRLYVAGQTPRALTAFDNLKRICEEHLAGRYSIEVIDLLERPQLARGDQIIAVPTLVRRLPEPMRKIIGDLSDTERVLVGLQLFAAHRLLTVSRRVLEVNLDAVEHDVEAALERLVGLRALEQRPGLLRRRVGVFEKTLEVRIVVRTSGRGRTTPGSAALTRDRRSPPARTAG